MSQKNKRKQLEDELIQANEKHILSLEERCEILTKENEAQKQYLKNRELEIENLMQKCNATNAEVDMLRQKRKDKWVEGLEKRYDEMLIENKKLREEVNKYKHNQSDKKEKKDWDNFYESI